MAVGVLVGMITLRTRGPTFIISTIALVLLAKIALDNWDYIGGANGMSLPLLPLPVQVVKLLFYYGMLIVAIGAAYLSFRIRRSKFGLGLRAIAQDETGPRSPAFRPGSTRSWRSPRPACSSAWPAHSGATT